MSDSVTRCRWVGPSQLYLQYHDEEWGVPQWDDQKLFEMLNLEGAQAGLSWITVLNKRKRYQEVFDGFDAEKIVEFSATKLEELRQDPGIIRNRLKIAAVVNNARQYLEIKSKYPSFAEYIWQFVDGTPIINQWSSLDEVPATTSESDQMSKVLKKQGFKFVGSTICYAYMQAVGMVNDHTTDCFRWKECQ